MATLLGGMCLSMMTVNNDDDKFVGSSYQEVLTTHEVVYQGVDSGVRVAQHVRDQSETGDHVSLFHV